jgi:hypothetical protein
MSQRYMTAEELATGLTLVDSAFPALAGGYVMVCVMFYERGFGVPLHRFLCSLLRSWDLELHHLW